jgi:hypothetical protein
MASRIYLYLFFSNLTNFALINLFLLLAKPKNEFRLVFDYFVKQKFG